MKLSNWESPLKEHLVPISKDKTFWTHDEYVLEIKRRLKRVIGNPRDAETKRIELYFDSLVDIDAATQRFAYWLLFGY